MTFDDETLARIRAALHDSDRLDAARVQLVGDGREVVLRGAVATAEEATVAAMLAERETGAVRNELRVDAGLRESTAAAPPATGEQPGAPQRSPEDPSQPADDLTSDVEEALGENIAWDPPETPSLAPTRAEERGRVDRDVTAAPSAPAGDVDDPDDVEPSAADLSAAELERRARPRPQPREDR